MTEFKGAGWNDASSEKHQIANKIIQRAMDGHSSVRDSCCEQSSIRVNIFACNKDNADFPEHINSVYQLLALLCCIIAY